MKNAVTSRPMLEPLECRTFASATTPTSLLVPAYFSPVPGGGWDQLAVAAQSDPVTAILNLDSGPGKSPDPLYTAAIDQLRDAGGHVIGYVNTSYGRRALATVEAEVRTYAADYALDGIFIDEMATTTARLPYYQALYAYLKQQDPAYEVIANPGTSTQQSYLATPTADVLVNLESNQSAYPRAKPSPWTAQYPASDFANIIGKAATPAKLHSDLTAAHSRRAGYVYITDQNLNNNNTAYDRLPTYWAQEVAAVKAENI